VQPRLDVRYEIAAIRERHTLENLRHSTEVDPAHSSHQLMAEDDATMADDMSVEKKIELLAEKIDALTVKTDALTVKTDGLTSDLGGIRSDLDQLSAKVFVGFEESHRLMKVSLEGLGALRETTDARFDTMSDEHAKQFDLLTKFGVHLRRRVERIDPPPRRRR
jgi:hypothetical protein